MADADDNQNEKIENDGGYEVGYGKPPKASRFISGQSGNPKGRPKGANNFTTDVQSLLRTRVKVRKDGKLKSMSSQEAALFRLFEQALAKGSPRALDRFLELARTFNDDLPPEAESAPLSETDLEIFEDFFARRRIESEDDEDVQDAKTEARS